MTNTTRKLMSKKNTPDMLKGGLALSIEKALGQSFAPYIWIYGPAGGEEWPLTSVCPLVLGFAGSLYATAPEWLRDEMFAYVEKIANSRGTDEKLLERRAILAEYAIEESFRLNALSKTSLLRKKKAILAALSKGDEEECLRIVTEVLNSIGAPTEAIPLLTTLRYSRPKFGRGIEVYLRNSVLSVAEIPAHLSKEAATRAEFLAVWDRAFKVLERIL